MSKFTTPAYVLWLGPTGLGVVRALGRAGVPVVGCHPDANEPGAGTRYARVEILPPVESDPGAWLKFLADEASRFAPRKAVLMVAGDPYWLFVAKHRAELSRHYLIAMPDAADIEQWMTKSWQAQAASRAGIAMPRSVTPRDRFDLRRISGEVEYPCILKPTVSHVWRERYPHKLAFVRSANELLTLGEDAMSRRLSFAVQEYIPAEDSDIYGLYCALDRHSRPLAMCVSRKVRQFEPRFGSGCVSRCVHQPKVVELGLRFLQSIGYHGIASVEFKRDARDGEFKMMEANLRPPLMMGHATDSGVNLPLASYCDLLGKPLPLQTPRRLGRSVGIIAQDFHAARFYVSIGKLTWARWICSWLWTRDTHFAWDDLGPFKGYVHMLWDHLRRGKFRSLPDTFPSIEQWNEGVWRSKPAATARWPRAAGRITPQTLHHPQQRGHSPLTGAKLADEVTLKLSR